MIIKLIKQLVFPILVLSISSCGGNTSTLVGNDLSVQQQNAISIDNSATIPVLNASKTTTYIYIRNNTHAIISGINYASKVNLHEETDFIDEDSAKQCASIGGNSSCALKVTTPNLDNDEKASALVSLSYTQDGIHKSFSNIINFASISSKSGDGVKLSDSVDLTNHGYQNAYGVIYLYVDGENQEYKLDGISFSNPTLSVVNSMQNLNSHMSSGEVLAVEVTSSKGGTQALSNLLVNSSHDGATYSSSMNVGVEPSANGAYLTYGMVPLINSALNTPHELFITNAGNESAIMTNFTATGGINIIANECAVLNSLPSGGKCVITFSVPRNSANGNISLNYTSDSIVSPVNVNAAVTWFYPSSGPLLKMVVVPNVVNFVVNHLTTATVTVTNIGAYILDGLHVSVSTASANASVQVLNNISNLCEAESIAVGASCSYNITLQGLQAGTSWSSLNITGTYNSGHSYNRMINLNYTVQPILAALTLTESSLGTNFNNVEQYSTPPVKNFILTNTGTGPANGAVTVTLPIGFTAIVPSSCNNLSNIVGSNTCIISITESTINPSSGNLATNATINYNNGSINTVSTFPNINYSVVTPSSPNIAMTYNITNCAGGTITNNTSCYQNPNSYGGLGGNIVVNLVFTNSSTIESADGLTLTSASIESFIVQGYTQIANNCNGGIGVNGGTCSISYRISQTAQTSAISPIINAPSLAYNYTYGQQSQFNTTLAGNLVANVNVVLPTYTMPSYMISPSGSINRVLTIANLYGNPTLTSPQFPESFGAQASQFTPGAPSCISITNNVATCSESLTALASATTGTIYPLSASVLINGITGVTSSQTLSVFPSGVFWGTYTATYNFAQNIIYITGGPNHKLSACQVANGAPYSCVNIASSISLDATLSITDVTINPAIPNIAYVKARTNDLKDFISICNIASNGSFSSCTNTADPAGSSNITTVITFNSAGSIAYMPTVNNTINRCYISTVSSNILGCVQESQMSNIVLNNPQTFVINPAGTYAYILSAGVIGVSSIAKCSISSPDGSLSGCIYESSAYVNPQTSLGRNQTWGMVFNSSGSIAYISVNPSSGTKSYIMQCPVVASEIGGTSGCSILFTGQTNSATFNGLAINSSNTALTITSIHRDSGSPTEYLFACPLNPSTGALSGSCVQSTGS